MVATEFVGASITSPASTRLARAEAKLADNPHIRFVNVTRRGYVRMEATRERLRADLRVTRSIVQPRSDVDTLASFVVEDGRPGATQA